MTVNVDSLGLPNCDCGHDLVAHCQEDEVGLYESPDGCFFCDCKTFTTKSKATDKLVLEPRCLHFWRHRHFRGNDGRWHCHKCVVKRNKKLADKFRSNSRMDVWFKE